MAVPDGWPPARASGCTEPGLQASSPAACTLTCSFVVMKAPVPFRFRQYGPQNPVDGGPAEVLGVGSDADSLQIHTGAEASAGTGKTHLATGLCVAACRQKRRARFTTAANLVNELVEARQHNAVKRVLARWLRYDVIVLDEVGYVPLADIGAEFLFQVIAERAERATLIVTTNLPFSEWTQVFPNPRLCKALLDRITDRAHIIETGAESYRFRRTLEVRQKKKAS